jgi:hypothetical protein
MCGVTAASKAHGVWGAQRCAVSLNQAPSRGAEPTSGVQLRPWYPCERSQTCIKEHQARSTRQGGAPAAPQSRGNPHS